MFVRQGHYARDPEILAACPAADVSIESIAELAHGDRLALLDSEGAGGPSS